MRGIRRPRVAGRAGPRGQANSWRTAHRCRAAPAKRGSREGESARLGRPAEGGNGCWAGWNGGSSLPPRSRVLRQAPVLHSV
jgi:hypothetical protein